MARSNEIQSTAPNFKSSSKLFNLNLSAQQNMNKSLSDLRSISRDDEQIGRENGCGVQPPIYQQFDRFQCDIEGESSAPYRVSLFLRANYWKFPGQRKFW